MQADFSPFAMRKSTGNYQDYNKIRIKKAYGRYPNQSNQSDRMRSRQKSEISDKTSVETQE